MFVKTIILMRENLLGVKSSVTIVALLLLSFGCKKTEDTPVIPDPTPTVNTPNVYVSGSEGTTAKVWKNGIATNLSNGVDTSVAISVFVSGSDVYAAGFEGNVAKVWKNGIATNLTNAANGRAKAYAVYVVGSDVYVAGEQNNGTSNRTTAKLWKNGIVTNLSTSTTKAAAFSVFVVGSDVYVAGAEDSSSIFSSGFNISSVRAKLWKNGIATSLTNSNSINKNGIAYSVFVSGADVYVAGSTDDSVSVTGTQATFWKNGVPTYLTNGSNDAYATSISVSGNDVYVAGNEYNGVGLNNLSAKVWKNSTLTSLANGTTGNYASSIFVKGTDVYVTKGTFNNNGTFQNSVVLKNGLLSNFFNAPNTVGAYSIFVN
jgi:uncharacterized protein YpmS